MVVLNITHICVKNFHAGKGPQTAAEFSHDLEIPIRLVHQVIFELTEAGVLSEVKKGDTQTIAYQPARDIDDLTMQNVIDFLDRRGIDNIPVAQTESLQALKDKMKKFHDTIVSLPENVLLKDVSNSHLK